MNFSIAFITTEEILGGGETNLLLVGAEFKEKGINTLIIAPNLLYKLGIERGLNMYKLDSYNKYWLSGLDLIPNDKYVQKLTKILDKYDFVHAYNSNALTLAKFTKAKLIYTCHGPWEISNSRKAKKIVKYTDRIITVSKIVQKSLFKLKIKAEIIPLGYEPKLSAKNFNLKVSRSFINENKLNILCLARFQPIKGQLILIFSLIFLLLKRNDLRKKISIVFAGKAYENKDYIYFILTKFMSKILKILGAKVEFLGYVKNISNLFQDTDIVVIPSRYESFSMVCLESLYFGKPIIFPTNTACGEILNKKIYGESFINGSIKSLCNAIEKTFKNNLFGSPGQLRNRSLKYNISNQVKKMIYLYNNIN